MDELFKNILFIDDQYESYLPVLEPAAHHEGFTIITSENIPDGLKVLSAYASITDAVVLDLSFPAGEMQGKEGLKDIIRLYPHIPVIILTDSDTSKDLGIVVDCMKLGAYNYVGKSTLNPLYLFQVINNAIEDYRRKKYVNETKKTTDDELFYTIVRKLPGSYHSYFAFFGFELVSVSKPSGLDTPERLFDKAINWHKKLLKAINTPYKDALKINLKYFTRENNKVTCRIFFSLFAESQYKLSDLIRNVQEDIKLLFSREIQSFDQIYSFNNIIDDNVLTESLNYKDDFKYFVAFRKPEIVKKNQQIGYVKASASLINQDLLFPIETPTLNSNEFIKILATSRPGTGIDIELHARNLSISEIDFLKHIITNPAAINPVAYGSKGELWLKQYLNDFIETADENFFISLMIIQKEPILNHKIKIAVSDSFLGKNAVFESRDPKNLMRFSIENEKSENRLPLCYSLNQTAQGFRFPIPDNEKIEGVILQPSTFSFLPENLPDTGFRMGEKFSPTGNKEIRADASILSRHFYIMGQTGTGKTTLLKTMISDCINQDKGFALIDPHGDLFREIRDKIPDEKKHKIIIIDTVNPENSARFNPLKYEPGFPQTKSLIVNELLRVADNLYNLRETGGPMFELYFRHGLLLTMDEKVQEVLGQTDLDTFTSIFYDASFCKRLIEICDNSKTVEFFNNALQRHGESAFENIAPYITSKLTRFTDDVYIQQIMKGDGEFINFRKLIDDEFILLVKMDKGLIGSSNASLLGQLIISSILMAAMSRSDITSADRKPFFLFIDEFQNFIQGDIATALAEARKYGLSLIMANQTLGQLNQHVLESLLGNVGSFAFFRPGINDYDKIRQYVEPEFERRDVLKLPNFNCIARMLIDNIPSDPFVFQTII